MFQPASDAIRGNGLQCRRSSALHSIALRSGKGWALPNMERRRPRARTPCREQTAFGELIGVHQRSAACSIMLLPIITRALARCIYALDCRLMMHFATEKRWEVVVQREHSRNSPDRWYAVMHECNAIAKSARANSSARVVCLFSEFSPFIMPSTCRECGANEGQMRALTGYLVAHRGNERSAMRASLGISQQLLCREQRTGRDHVIDTFDRAAGWMNACRRMSEANARAATNKFPADGDAPFLHADNRLAAGVEARRR